MATKKRSSAPRVGIYVRISSDPLKDHDEGRDGVQRQQKDCEHLAERRGFDVIDIYEDNDLSASRYSRKPRKQFERLLADLDSGRPDGVVAYHLDRLYRQPKELERFIDVYARSGASVFATVSGDYDLTSGDGMLYARMLVNVAAKESDDKSRRLKGAFRDRAEKGLPKVAGTRPFGYTPDGMRLRKKEARVVKDAFERLIGGEPVY